MVMLERKILEHVWGSRKEVVQYDGGGGNYEANSQRH